MNSGMISFKAIKKKIEIGATIIKGIIVAHDRPSLAAFNSRLRFNTLLNPPSFSQFWNIFRPTNKSQRLQEPGIEDLGRQGSSASGAMRGYRDNSRGIIYE